MESLFTKVKCIAFDADDTLWVNEPYFRKAEEEYCAVLERFAGREEIIDTLYGIEPSAQSNSFTGHNISILYVPEESVDTYWETSPWNNEFFPLGLFKIEDYEVETKDENGNVLYSLIYSTTDDYSGVSVRIGQKPTTEVELVIPETLWYVEENFTLPNPTRT